jgi:uncharacterized protein YcgI (DUF1989 family)
MVDVELFDSQLALLDRVVATGEHGSGRNEVLTTVLIEHVAERMAGAPEYVGGRTRFDDLVVERPEIGATRLDLRLEPVTGKAIPVWLGEVLRIEQLRGGTCVDFNAFNMNDHKEHLDCGFTRSHQSFNPRAGELIWTNAPRGRPMFAIMKMADSCDLDIVGHRCNRVYHELNWDMPDHPNCQDTLAEAIREFGLTPDDVHDSFNMWMSTVIDHTGRRQVRWNPAGRGDCVELLALQETVAVPAICGVGELLGLNNYTFGPVRIEVCAASESTYRFAEAVNSKWGRMRSQVGTGAPDLREIHASRELVVDPDYEAAYRPVPDCRTLSLTVDAAIGQLLDGLLATHVYGETRGEALRASFMRWCNANFTLFRRARIVFE